MTKTLGGIQFPIKSRELRRFAARRDVCPECGSELDTGWECNVCGYDAMKEARVQDRTRAAFSEETCPGHIASEHDPKICGRCGIHIDSLRPDDDLD